MGAIQEAPSCLYGLLVSSHCVRQDTELYEPDFDNVSMRQDAGFPSQVSSSTLTEVSSKLPPPNMLSKSLVTKREDPKRKNAGGRECTQQELPRQRGPRGTPCDGHSNFCARERTGRTMGHSDPW